MSQTLSEAIWANVCRLLNDAGHGPAPSIDATHKAIKGKVGRGQLQRLSEGGNVTLKTIDTLADALGVPAWRLLQPQGRDAREPAGVYAITNNTALVNAIGELLERLPGEQRTPAADLLGAWVRTGQDEGRSVALLRLLTTKPRLLAQS